MNGNLLIICVLTFIIHLVGTLAYATRIAGIRTGYIATAITLFNLLVLVSRTSNTFQSPLIAKRIDTAGVPDSLLSDFRWILAAAALATVFGALLIPSAQRMFVRAVTLLQRHRSLVRVVWHASHPQRLLRSTCFLALPTAANLRFIQSRGGLSWSFLSLNVLAVALWTVGVFAALYAGVLEPRLALTCSQLSSIINGVATILMFLLIDPQLSMLTDDAIKGSVGQSTFRGAIASLVGARLLGVLLAQVLLLPAALIIVHVARAL